MKRKILSIVLSIGLIYSLGNIARAQAPVAPPEPVQAFSPQSGPTITGYSWLDNFDDDLGLVQTSNAAVAKGELGLSQVVPLGSASYDNEILSMVEYSDGRIFLGLDGALLNVYNPATGQMTNLGYPVPAECYT